MPSPTVDCCRGSYGTVDFKIRVLILSSEDRFSNLVPKSMIKDSGFRLRTVALVACCGALLVGCGGGSSTVSTGGRQPDAQSTRGDATTPPTETTEQPTAITRASTTAREAVAEVDNDATDAEVTAAENAITALNTAIGNAEDLPPTELAAFRVTRDALTASLNKAKTSRTAAQTAATTARTTESRQATQRTAITGAVTAAEEAVDEVDNDATDAEVAAADEAINALNTAIGNAEDLPPTELATVQATRDVLTSSLNRAKTSRTAAQTAQAQAQTQRAREAVAEAKKMFGAIFPYNPTPSGLGGAQYTSADTVTVLSVINRTDADPPTAASSSVNLKEDKTVAISKHPFGGWTRKKYTLEGNDDIAEAVVYADLEKTQGLQFGVADNPDTDVNESINANYKYKLLPGSKVLSVFQDDSDAPLTFNLVYINPSQLPRATGTETISSTSSKTTFTFDGEYDGVPGQYTCETSAGGSCTAKTSAKQGFFTLDATGGSTWTFEVSNGDLRVTASPDETYASYGWWIHKPPGDEWTASAFHAYRPSPPAVIDLTDITGSATYTGGATGWFALSSATGGKNESGSFTASVSLEANFSDDTIDGDISQFQASDGTSKPWKVKLSRATLASTITGTETVWSMNDVEGACDTTCPWGGTFYESDTTDPTAAPNILTGHFYTEFGTEGKMVGSFGTRK